MQFSWKACLITLMFFSVLSLQVNAGGDDSKVVTVNSGETAELFYPVPDDEQSENFQGYRAYKDNRLFAYMNKSLRTGSCTTDNGLKDFCLEKMKFQKWNETVILLKIINTSVNDSGYYAVEYRFKNLTGDHKEERELIVNQTLKVNGKPTGSTPSQVDQSTKGYSHITETVPTTSGAMLHLFPLGLFVFHLFIVGINEYTG